MRKKSATRTLKHDENEVFGLIEVIRPPTILRRKRPHVGARKKILLYCILTITKPYYSVSQYLEKRKTF